MTILEALLKLTGSMPGLVTLLEAAALAAPDLKPKIDQWIQALTQSASKDNLVSLAAALPAEIARIAQFKVDPHSHPSDAI